MTSDKKIAANKNNATRSPGPTTKLGKERSKRNATKHGVLALELVVNETDKPEFEALRRDLYDQLSPATTLQNIGFQRILSSIWRSKLALRLEGKRILASFHYFDQSENPVEEDPSAEGFLPTKWYGTSGADLRAAIRFLSHLSKGVEENGCRHAEELKTDIVRLFDENFYALITRWAPMNISTAQLADMLTGHAETFNLPLPEADLLKDQGVVDPALSLQMSVKIINLMQQALEGLARVSNLGADGAGPERHATVLDLAARYYTTATRDLERAVAWYQDLREQRL